MSNYVAEIEWTANPEEDFRSGRYSRVHEICFDNGLSVRASASPGVVPKPYADPTAVDPEELMVAALSSCHMLSFLDLARRAGVTVLAYHDAAEGILEKSAEGRVALTKVTLRPRIDCDADRATLDELHHKAHDVCFIANSVRTDVRVEPVFEPARKEARHG
ncbi:OsmC family protein [Mesorhizobium sp. YM1C-6-2]|uniref:OsmC family protein n=1 Tax=Mesorhizobium sp. YM1C-6-2 TaxID=1827501 RepID=UPI000EF20C9B|nr:OsmC family protein [Mesorhizobium sp. YM1C-6-2]RLP28344.1 OsmC family peroxiredoxin [Mesorhizobium sp. YM1C-6-2]